MYMQIDILQLTAWYSWPYGAPIGPSTNSNNSHFLWTLGKLMLQNKSVKIILFYLNLLSVRCTHEINAARKCTTL